MKKFMLILLLFCASVGYSQIAEQWVWYGTATTSWTFIAKDTSKAYIKTLQFLITSDDADGDTLWIALGTDTTVAASGGKAFPLLAGESIYYSSTYVAGIRIKASDSVPYRIRLH